MAKKKSSSKAKLNAGTILEELKTPGLIILGMVGGSLAGKLIDKVVKVNTSATGFQAKALVKPIVQISVGVGGALFLKDRNFKLIASGIAASGIASTIKVFLKKDILQGLTEITGLGASDTVKQVFREPISLSIEPYNPDLPKLSSQVAALPVESDEEIMGNDLGEYEEIKEISIL